jgi:hypothetical protein
VEQQSSRQKVDAHPLLPRQTGPHQRYRKHSSPQRAAAVYHHVNACGESVAECTCHFQLTDNHGKCSEK